MEFSDKQYTVYKHTNKINGKIYIGITKQDPKRRWQNGKGYKGTYFGNAIEKYGWDNFSHSILFERLDIKEACKLEKEYIKYYKSNKKEYGYNIADGGQVVVNPNNKTGKDNKRSTPIKCYDKNYNFIKEYESQNLAAKDLNISRKGITKNCRGISKTYKGYIFEYSDITYKKPEKCSAGKHKNHYTRKINLLDDNGNIIKSFNSIVEASREFEEDNVSGINKCCLGILNSYHERRWCYGL